MHSMGGKERGGLRLQLSHSAHSFTSPCLSTLNSSAPMESPRRFVPVLCTLGVVALLLWALWHGFSLANFDENSPMNGAGVGAHLHPAGPAVQALPRAQEAAKAAAPAALVLAGSSLWARLAWSAAGLGGRLACCVFLVPPRAGLGAPARCASCCNAGAAPRAAEAPAYIKHTSVGARMHAPLSNV